jgi:hypothetical protein
MLGMAVRTQAKASPGNTRFLTHSELCAWMEVLQMEFCEATWSSCAFLQNLARKPQFISEFESNNQSLQICASVT